MRILATIRLAGLLFAAALGAACGSPTIRVHELATLHGFERVEVQGDDFVHVTYRRLTTSTPERIHVYIEHDGLPWATTTRVSPDPTPRDPLVLRLAVQDPMPAIYLGRPCYFGMAGSAKCSAPIWTHRRYSEQVITSMAAALQRMLGEGKPELVFVGHSGGGTLAWLLAQRFAATRAVVTVAGNLDVRAWQALHGYTALAGSLSPAETSDLPPQVVQVHYVGSNDAVVPPVLVHNFVRQRPNAAVIEVPRFDHRCCWERAWPAILDDIAVRIAKLPSQDRSRQAAGEQAELGARLGYDDSPLNGANGEGEK